MLANLSRDPVLSPVLLGAGLEIERNLRIVYFLWRLASRKRRQGQAVAALVK